jgi:hypothetical protein
MSNKLDFSLLEAGSSEPRKWARRDANAVVQMSLRMPVQIYERFRDHCERERRTNGDMLEEMMKSYEKQAKNEVPFLRD